MPIKTKPIPSPPFHVGALNLDVAVAGLVIAPIERLRHMSAQTWADFIFEWVHSLKSKYARTEQCDGSGDMGRDIVAFESLVKDDPWDNYQCKHYDHPLMPTDVWVELAKLAYYTFIKEYSLPRRYVFVAPQGAGNTLSKLLRRPDELRKGLFAAWDKYCHMKISIKNSVTLDASLTNHIKRMDFSIFTAISPLTLIEEHRSTPWYTARFGGGLPPRSNATPPPKSIAANETNYVRALLDAYEDHLRIVLGNVDDLSDEDLINHFSRSRREFYSAESLREFSRDNVPAGTFEGLLDEVHDGVIDVVQATHADAYERVLATVKQAKALQLTANALVARTWPADRGGICHQLANDLRVRWRR
jgi:hypothetical protein